MPLGSVDEKIVFWGKWRTSESGVFNLKHRIKHGEYTSTFSLIVLLNLRNKSNVRTVSFNLFSFCLFVDHICIPVFFVCFVFFFYLSHKHSYKRTCRWIDECMCFREKNVFPQLHLTVGFPSGCLGWHQCACLLYLLQANAHTLTQIHIHMSWLSHR